MEPRSGPGASANWPVPIKHCNQKPLLSASSVKSVKSVVQALLCAAAWAAWQLAAAPADSTRDWRPAPDEVYLQEVGRKVPTAQPLTSVAAHGGRVFAGSEAGLLELNGGTLARVGDLRAPVERLVEAGGSLYVLARDGVVRLRGNQWEKISDQPMTDLCEHLGEVVAAHGARLWRLHAQALEPLPVPEAPFSILRLISFNETLYLVGAGRVTLLGNRPAAGQDEADFYPQRAWDWGEPPSPLTRDALSLGSRLFLATDRGLGVLRGMSMSALRGEQGLCYEDTTCLARGFTNDLWIGTTRGAIRMAGGEFQYFAGQRWLPDDRVSAIAASERAVYVATAGGLGIIEYEPYTLLKKAAYYERHLEEWGQKRFGLTHKLEWDETLGEYVREASDNDGGYSGNYLAAESYRYAVTQDARARQEAVNTFKTMRWLEAITGIPGLPARAIWVKGERGHKSGSTSGGYPSKWNQAADPRFEWKGDTSSDEICSHFHSVSLFLELAAQGGERQEARKHLARIAGHLLDHHWQLIDVSGKPTRWGRWDPGYFNTEDGRADRGLQSAEILSFMSCAATLTGEARFNDAYQALVALGYPAYTVRLSTTFPPEEIAHFDNELAFWVYPNLLRYEKDPALRSAYRRSFERTWELLRIEHVPWFNFVYGALTGNECELQPALAHLREWPLDLVIYSYQNSHRADLKTPAGYEARKGGTRAFSPRETEPMRWDHWTMEADGGTGGHDVVEPSAWLMAYWMGRYCGFIQAPTATDPALLTAGPSARPPRGARPYDGPQRPESF